MSAIPPWAAAAIGLALGFLLRQLHVALEDRRRRRWHTLYTQPLKGGLLRALLELAARTHTEGDAVRLKVAVGGKMTREAWATVSWKLLDLLGGVLDARDRKAVEKYITTAGRAWADLEQQATDQAPGQDAPPAPTS